MHDIEPHFAWRDKYEAEKDEKSPFYGRTYDEFTFSTKIYNYFIHPQWDDLGSNTLYGKLIYANYDNGFAMIELIGEWNDCLFNDIMFLKQNIIDTLMRQGIHKFAIVGENVLNFHASDDCYYEEWWDEVIDQDGWIVGLNFRDHVLDEMNHINLSYYINYNGEFNNFVWRSYKPEHVYQMLDSMVMRFLT